jgi:hypothetical protein
LIRALRAFADELGKPPTRTAMNEDGPYSSQPYYREFGGWNDALAAAGLGTNHRNDVPEAELVAELQRLDEKLDRVPRFEDMEERGAFSGYTYLGRWGSWPDAKAAAGLRRETQTSRRISEEELIEAIQDVAEEIGKPPTQVEMRELGRYSHRPYYRVYSSWNGAVRVAGFDPNHINGYDEMELIEEMRRMADKFGYPPTMEQMRTNGTYSPRPYLRAFGSWTDAWDAAGLEFRDENLAGRASREELLDALKKLANEVDRAPTREDMNERGDYSHEPFVYRFGSWSAALEAVGFSPYRSPDEAQEPVRHGADWKEQRQRALERDEFECQNCGISNKEHHQQDSGGLHVHHIRKHRRFDCAKRANRISNLITLCRYCHSDYERGKLP